MTSFNFNTFTTTAQTLANDENGSIGQSGGVSTVGANAVTGSGSFNISVLGSLAAEGGKAISSTSATIVSILTGRNGSIISSDSTAISIGSTPTTLTIENAGLIQGSASAIDFTATTGSLFLSNTGIMSGGTAVTIDASLSSGSVNIVNSGSITHAGNLEAIKLSGSSTAALTVTNSGTILTAKADNDVVSLVSLGDMTLYNSGTLKGDVSMTGLGEVEFVNNGLVQGNVVGGKGLGTFDLRGGRVTGTVSGGDGSDTYLVDNSSVTLIEQGLDLDTDAIRSSVTFTAGVGFESLTLTAGESHMAILGLRKKVKGIH